MIDSDVIDRLTSRVAAGARLDDSELEALGEANVLALGMLSETARRRTGRHVSYARIHAITVPSAVGAPIPTTASEVRILSLPASLEEATALVRRVRASAGSDVRVTAFSLADLHDRTAHGWGDLAGVARALADAGADDVAELPIDRIEPLSETVRVFREGGLVASRLTIDRPAGSRRVELITRVRNLQERMGGVAHLAPLARRPPADVPTTGYDDLRTIALACLALVHLAGPSRGISIEVDWKIYGPKLAQVALMFGADHLDGVSPTSDPSLGARRGTVQDVERNIRAAGFEPVAIGRREV